ncbi:cell wall beta-glucan synthesis [Pochonia chlamydosporia 170]|uniref:Cell wall beta-glucan synthesis n=1 Tax=Pochonia chlamydosporia 170 TaxID=1380566 RepID=A0A179G3H4_METCM|nr:cell wall beta-glucan synthesis [Pochonia chlamydosporia 170]OAQ72307.1 cell wall beta-glucan synthesis [Pochonia chlamydosporia 170]
MRFSITAVLAFAATALAQTPDFDPIYTPKSGETIKAGAPFTVTWTAPPKYADGTIKIELIGGATQPTQVKLADIASGVKNSANTYTWNVDASLGDKAVYGLVFRLESNPSIFQYSNPFHIKGSDGASGSGSVTKTTSHGVKTVTLSSTSTPVTTTSAPVTTKHSTIQLNTTVPCNTTTLVKTTAGPTGPVVITSTAVVNPSNPATTSPTGAPVPTGAASAVRVGSLTIMGVVAAVLAL